jgi:PPP family 3-phenylpropionic acid transporter
MRLTWFADRNTSQISEPSNRLLLAVIYFFYFGQLGVFVPYVGVFLDARSLDSAQIGTLLAVVALLRIVGPNLWANFADRTGQAGEILRLGCLLSFITFVSILYVDSFWGMTFAFAIMMMFWTAVLPQLEVITVSATKLSKGGYGAVRLWGSIGFIVCTVVVGWLLDVFPPEVVVYAAMITLLGLFISTLCINSKVTDHAEPEVIPSLMSRNIWRLGFIVFLLGNTLLQVSFGSFYNFFALYMRALDYSGMQTGVFIGLGVAAEVIVFIYATRLIKQFGVKALLVISILATALRWLLLALFPQFTAIIVFTQVIHALSFGLTHAASVYYLQVTFPRAFQSRAQALYVSIAFGVGGASGSYIAGLLWRQGEGAYVSFMFSAAMAFIASLILLALPHKNATAKA